MALFLQESVDTTAAPVLTFSEAQLGLLESVEAVAALTEATLQADFILHERNKGLSEEVITEAEAGFLSRIAARVKEILAKVRDAVVAFFQSAKEKLVALWKRITGTDATLRIPKSGKAAIEAAIGALEKLVAAVQEGPESAEGYAKNVEKAAKDLREVHDKLGKTISAEKATKSWVEVKAGELSKVNAFATRAAAIAGSCRAKLEADIAAAEKAAAKVKEPTPEATKAAQEELALLRAHAAGYNKLAGGAASTIVMIAGVIGGKTTSAAAAAPEATAQKK